MIKAGVLAWIVAEILVLALAVKMLGWPGTILLGIATTALGGAIVARAGRDALRTAMGAMNDPGSLVATPPAALGRLAAGLLLVVPGFLTDGLGFLLLAPPVRNALVRRFASKRSKRGDGAIDLEPDQWRSH